MSILIIIATGIISGVISAFLLFIARTLIIGHLLPWYFDRVYRGINIEGTWYASPYEMLQDLKMELKQVAGTVTGNAQFSLRPPTKQRGFEDVREFNIEGRIQDRYMTLTLSHKNRQRIGVISMLLEPVCDGRELNGMMAFVSMRENELSNLRIHFARDLTTVIEDREAIELAMREPPRQVRSPRKTRPNRAKKSTQYVAPDVSDKGELLLESTEVNDGEKIEIE